MTHKLTGKEKGQAIVREISDTYPECSLQYQKREPINLELAKIQLRAYIEALEGLGLRVLILPADHRFPDACFVEDTAVLLEDTAVITWMGAQTRNGEQEAVAECLAQWMDVVRMMPPAQLEGGDVLKIGKYLFVGESSRTNREGIEFLNAVACPRGYHVTAVPVRRALHLKTVVTYVGGETVIAAASILPQLKQYMRGFSVIELLEECACAANVLSLRGTVLVPKGYPQVSQQIAELGLAIKELELSEFKKGGAGLTCLSLILD
ncbi:MAG: hypothetical protein HY581_09895 [Nitrospirae bacterium]|nr:hypothetical protein [Nitrospirota bacterium]